MPVAFVHGFPSRVVAVTSAKGFDCIQCAVSNPGGNSSAPKMWDFDDKFWLVVSTHLKNMSQIGSSPQIGMKVNKCLKPPSGFVWPVVQKFTLTPYLHIYIFNQLIRNGIYLVFKLCKHVLNKVRQSNPTRGDVMWMKVGLYGIDTIRFQPHLNT